MPARFTALGLVVVLALWLLAGCAGQEEEEEGTEASQKKEEVLPEPPVVGEFVGEIPEADAFVAILGEEPAEEGLKQGVRAYLSDGKSIFEWFVGGATTPLFQLSSEDDDAQLDLRLSPESAVDDITLANNESFSFEAPPASGISGFYPVVITPEGLLSATSWSGAQLFGRVFDGEVTGTIIPPEGEPVDLAFSDPNIEAGEWRWIFFDGGLRGGTRDGRLGIHRGNTTALE